MTHRIAVLIPCLNEEIAIPAVVKDIREHLPEARVLVFDNRSTDRTAEVAQAAGAEVIPSLVRGKGNVVRHMFRDIDADVYLMIDGDGTYQGSDLVKLKDLLIQEQADMVVGDRLSGFEEESFRPFHQFGNHLVAWVISKLFKVTRTDVFSGGRAFSRAFVKSIPIMSAGFDVETELTLHAAAKRFHVLSLPIKYGVRPEGSFSKLNTLGDGFLVLRTLLRIVKDFRPLLFFSTLSLLTAIASFAAGIVPVVEFMRTQFITHIPLAILAAGLGVLSAVWLAIALILDSAYRYHAEIMEMLKDRS